MDGALRRRDPQALARAREELETEMLFYQYVQWLADEQWQDAREATPCALFGDFPFMVAADSADVWSRQHLFRFDATVGSPPDAFSATGQDWGMPVYRWDVMDRDDYRWLRERAKRSARLFDGYRIDHLVGFYRTFSRPLDERRRAASIPRKRPIKLALGERLMAVFMEAGRAIIAEDLGVVPDFVRGRCRLGIPGTMCFRWERDGRRRPAVHRPPRYPRSRWRRPARTTPTRSRRGGRRPHRTSATPFAELPAIAALRDGRAGNGAVHPGASRRHPACASFTSASDLLLVPVSRHLRVDRSHQHACHGHRRELDVAAPWPVDTLAEQPAARERLRAAPVGARDGRTGIADPDVDEN